MKAGNKAINLVLKKLYFLNRLLQKESISKRNKLSCSENIPFVMSYHIEMQFSDCIRTENCLYDLSNRTDREAVFSDRISLSSRTDREAAFSDRISLSILDMTVPQGHLV